MMSGDRQLECDIRTTVEGSLVRLEALAVAGPAARGSYSFLIRKGGPSGTTQNRQGGSFAVSAGETRVISTSMISAGPGDHYEAKLTLQWNGETRSCSVDG